MPPSRVDRVCMFYFRWILLNETRTGCGAASTYIEGYVFGNASGGLCWYVYDEGIR